MVGKYGNGSDVAVIWSRIRSVYSDKDYYIPVSILYPLSGKES